jgi:hypothetical protein
VTDDKKDEITETPAGNDDAAGDSAAERDEQGSTQSGPKFTQGPDPLAGLKKTTTDMMASMEGKTVSLKLYVGTIIGVVLLMLLARCS